MRLIGWLILGAVLGTLIGCGSGWIKGTLELREYPEYLAGEPMSEDDVPRVLYQMIGGFLGCGGGAGVGVAFAIREANRRDEAIVARGSSSDP
jgi:hypothetical protein